MPNRTATAGCIALCALLLGICAACNKQDAASGRSAAGQPAARDAAAATAGPNLLAAPALLRFPPLALSFNRLGDVLFATMTNPTGGSPLVYRFRLEEDKLSQPEVMYESLNLLQAYLRCNPAGDECIVLSNRKNADGTVWDMVFRLFEKDQMKLVQYEATPGMPTTGKTDTWYATQPFYSWDGAQVAIPLKYDGMVVQGLEEKQGRYAAYPQLPFKPSAMAFGPLPDANAKKRIWASFWQAGTREDVCLLFTLDLASMQWQQVFKLNWIVYHVGGQDFDNAPWVVAGSRAAADAIEGRRYARFGRIDPAGGAEDLAEFFGTPDFEVALAPHGDYIAYTDSVRQALVRLNPATGEVDIDPRWYADDSKLFIGEGGDKVYAWKGGMLMRGEWSKHERHPGWDDE